LFILFGGCIGAEDQQNIFEEQTGLAWSGAVSFGDCFVNYVGPTGDNSSHRHFALQIVIGKSVSVLLRDGMCATFDSIYIRPNVEHRLLPSDKAALYLIEPHSDLGRRLLEQLPPASAGPFEDGAKVLDDCITSAVVCPLDPRLSAVMTNLAGPGALHRPIAEVSRASGLSPQRLRAITAKELGMPLSKWRLWAALRRASDSLANGSSIAAAAHDGGFSDQAHFTRVMRATLGITPQTSKQALTV
jgi:AraC-like DNA-binding protein